MNTYKITCRVDRYFYYTVKANSKEDAIKQINNDLVDHDRTYTDYDSLTIHSIKKQEVKS